MPSSSLSEIPKKVVFNQKEEPFYAQYCSKISEAFANAVTVGAMVREIGQPADVGNYEYLGDKITYLFNENGKRISRVCHNFRHITNRGILQVFAPEDFQPTKIKDRIPAGFLQYTPKKQGA